MSTTVQGPSVDWIGVRAAAAISAFKHASPAVAILAFIAHAATLGGPALIDACAAPVPSSVQFEVLRPWELLWHLFGHNLE